MHVHPLLAARRVAAAVRCKRAVAFAAHDTFTQYTATVRRVLFARLRAAVAELEPSHDPAHQLLVRQCVPVLHALLEGVHTHG